MPEGKKRSYDNSRRSAQARLTRTEVYRAAFRLFGEQGYAATSLPQIAAAAGVSVETVRKMGPKSGLLDGAREVAVFDESGVDDMLDTTFLRDVAAQQDLAGAVDVLVDFYATSNQRAAAFWQAWRAAAAGDPVVAAAWEREMASAHGGFRTGIEYAAGRGWLRQDVSVEELAATLWVLAASETYTRLTVDAGLTDEDYRGWLRRMLLEQLAPR